MVRQALLGSAAIGIATVLVAEDSRAFETVGIEVGAKAGYALTPSAPGATNIPGVGVGARAGLTFPGPDGLYVGGSVVYYPGGNLGDETQIHLLLYGPELAYGIKVNDLLTVRPEVGIGDATSTVTSAGVSESTSSWYVEPGVMLLASKGNGLVGADANLLLFPGWGSQPALSFDFQFGVRF